MAAFRSVTVECHARLSAHVHSGDRVVDATAGNGHDTRMLADRVGEHGQVYAIDLQPVALEATRTRLEAEGLAQRVTLLQGDHAQLASLLPRNAFPVSAIVFNLGYLPGGDTTLTSRAEGTVAALCSSRQILQPGGALAIVCYPGHPEGAREAVAVRNWAEALSRDGTLTLEEFRAGPTRRPAPFLLWIRKRQGR